ncbi:MAG: phenylalanine--tRNA ligase subunit beta [Truepera sp.]|nr:phenylalanine--tRNA ligase subunit beta [Truepera sp.]
MRVPVDWLRSFFDELPPLDRLVEVLVGLGLEVEAVHELPGPPNRVVVADIVSVRPVAGSDQLVMASVDDGAGGRSVVCGAPNTRPGLRTALALPGASLSEGGLEVGLREVLGQRSDGVLCSPRELGLFDYAAGLIEFGADVAVGAELADLWPAEQVIELELTPNRGDACSLLGVARDLSAKLDRPFIYPAVARQRSEPEIGDGLGLRIEDARGCPRFTLQRIDDVEVRPSPLWLQRRLAALGLRPRNSIVDVTNFVTFELGQPSHAYDREVLGDETLVVRRARAGERITALNEQELVFTDEDLVIATPDRGDTRVIGVAGVIGGLDDSVRDSTSQLALEVAHFDPVTVRKTARRHDLVTDAHYRFERGVDPNLPPVASARASQLIAEIAGGRVHPGLSEFGGDRDPASIEFRPSRVHFLIDFEVPLPEQRRYLEALGCTVAERSADAWTVTAPTWRFDLAIEEDIVEEVARLHGYDKIGETIPIMRFVPQPGDPTHRTLRIILASSGFQETLSYSFTGSEEIARSRAPAARVELLNPQGVERSVLRTALYPGLLAAAEVNRGTSSLALFEIGRVFGAEEEEHLALLLSGDWQEAGWRPAQPLDFFLVKGLLERLASFANADIELVAATPEHLHPGVAASVCWNGREVGTVGRLHPEVASAYGLDVAFVAELLLPLEPKRLAFEAFSRQPHVERDLAVVVPSALPFATLRRLVADSAGTHLENLEPFDLYRGSQVPAGHKSLALRLRFRRSDRSLTDEEVDGYMGNIISAVRGAGYDIRE